MLDVDDQFSLMTRESGRPPSAAISSDYQSRGFVAFVQRATPASRATNCWVVPSAMEGFAGVTAIETSAAAPLPTNLLMFFSVREGKNERVCHNLKSCRN